MTKTLGRGPTRSQRTLIVLAVVALFASLITVYVPLPAQADSHTPNQPGYWEDLYPNAVACYKYGANDSNAHGSSDGEAVTLNPYKDSWPGDHWEVLIVKGGSEGEDGAGNAIYEHPQAGVKYYPPKNSGDQLAEVSHWIVCKGEDPQEEPDEASVDVSGECVEDEFHVTISTENATVSIDLDGDGAYGAGETGLSSGTYEVTADDENYIDWEAEADAGAEFDEGETTSGEIWVEECVEDNQASADVRGACVEDEFHVWVSTEYATVSIDLNGDGDYDDAGETGLTGGSHTVTADPGDEISWHAFADEGAEFDEDVDEIDGKLTVEDCEPDEASASVTGQCVEEDFVITITVNHATVDIDLDGDGVLEAGEMDLGSGDYEFTGDDENWIPWVATADDDAEFDDGKTTKTGEIYIEECEEDFLATVEIGGVCVDEMFYVTVSTEHASVSVDLNGDGQFGIGETDLADGNHKVTADAGDEIEWHAVADEDAEFDEDIDELEGELDVEDCEEEPDLAEVDVDGECRDEDQPPFEVTVDAENATVSIDLNGDGDYNDTGETGLTGGTHVVTAKPDTNIKWEAIADEDAEFENGKQKVTGEIEVESCAEVLASIVVTVSGTCVLNGEVGQGVITVTIPVDGGATVVISDEDDKELATLTKSGTVNVPEGASYSWEAEANEGFEFPPAFVDNGELDIVECSVPEVQASVLVTVTGACFVVGSDGQGRITVDMSVDGAATVVITDKNDKVIATLTKPGTVTVDEGATYSWEAEANEGFEFPVGFNAEGDVVLATCSQPEELPFTGIDSEPLVAIATTLLGLGAVLVSSTRRREEF